MSRAGPGNRGPRGRSGGGISISTSSANNSTTTTTIRGPPSSLSHRPSPSATATASSPIPSSSTSRGPPTTTATLGRPGSIHSGPSSASTSLHSTGIIGHKDKSGRIVSYTSPDDKCPSCKTDRFLNPRLTLLVSPCYHKLCTSCIDRIWSLGPAPCPTCQVVCRKNQFGPQTFQDLGVEREVDLRKRIQKSFTKQQKDFPSLKEYNDYLEEIEQITFNLINRIDYDVTLAKFTTYENASRSSSSSDRTSALHMSSESLSAQVADQESQLAQLRRARMDKRKGYEMEDLKSRRDEEEEVVRAIEDGMDEEEIEAVQSKWKRKREERELDRDRDEEEALKREADIRRGFELQVANRGPSAKATALQVQGNINGATSQITSSAWVADSLQNFTGPLATLSSGLNLFVDPSSRRDITLLPPTRLRTPTTGTVSTSTTPSTGPSPSTSTSLTPYDPWTQPVLDKMQAQEIEAIKAGGFDWCENWRWELGVANGSLVVGPPA